MSNKTKEWLDKNNVTYRIGTDGLFYIDGSITIAKNENITLEFLAEVSGSVYVWEGGTLTAPALVKSGSVYVGEGGTLTAPALVKSSTVNVRKGTTFTAPELVESGSMYVGEGATFTAPALVTIEHVRYETEIFGCAVRVFDSIGCIVLSEKIKDGITIRHCRKAQFKDKELVGEKFYIASNEKYNAHGETIRQASEELLFKSGTRDISEYKNMPLETIKTPQDWAFIYRMATGACQTGVRIFMDGHKLKKKYSLQEIIEHTANQHGAEKFRSVVVGK